MHTMEFEFGYRERIEGVIIAEYDGTATITSRSGRRDDSDWVIVGLRLDGQIENARRRREPDGVMSGPLFVDVDVDLPHGHQLFMKIMIELLQGPQRDEISHRWTSQMLAHREERAA